ncbi:MAG: 2Fe-2S iron-sulfur cluster-binding protein [Gammaproteobacteria bacterium]
MLEHTVMHSCRCCLSSPCLRTKFQYPRPWANTRACITPIEAVRDKAILTIEGLSPDRSHPLQLAWKQHQVSQCGYCQSGQIMAAAALLDKHDTLSEAVIEQEMDGVLCRCGSYQRIKQAILSAARQTHGKKSA